MASKSIRDHRLTSTRISVSKKDAAILLFADNLPATEVAKIVGIALDSARFIRDHEHGRIMKFRETITREYERLWKRDIEAYYKREAEIQYRQLWQQIRKKQKALKSSYTSAKYSRSRCP